ncbi:glycosyltransferase family 64 protein c4 [Quercus suber]|uniref:Glycosyltransferase family 64 protein c4 n=1 Tax=Quercus suber TaxID=58331 RepID=A0AAW0KNW9_QUESU
MSTLIGIRGEDANSIDALSSPAKEKAANRGAYSSRSPLLLRRARQLLGEAKLKLFLGFFALCVVVFVTSRLSSFMGWNPHYPSSVSSPSRGGYTVLINTWKRNSLLKQSVAHYASCSGTEAIHVSQTAQKPNFKFDINEEDNLNNRFKPIEDLKQMQFSQLMMMYCSMSYIEFCFHCMAKCSIAMVGFVPRMHWLEKAIRNVVRRRKLLIKYINQQQNASS